MKIYQINNYKDFKKFEYLYKRKNINNYEVFQSYEFLFNYMNFFKKKNYIVTIYIDNEDFVILPLYEFKYLFFSFVGFIGSPNLSEINDIIHNIQNRIKLFEVLKKVFNYLKKNKLKNFFFNNIKKGYFFEFLNSQNFELISSLDMNLCNIQKRIFLNDLIEKKENKKINFKIRKFYRHSSKKIHRPYSIFKQNEDINILIKDFIFKNKKMNYFYKNKFLENLEFIFYLQKNSKLLIFDLLNIGDEIGSIILGFKFKNKFFYSIPAYNKDYRKYSLGNYHLREFIYYNKNNFNYIIFGPGNESYKKKFNIINEKNFSFTNSKTLKLVNFLKNFKSD